MKTTLKFSITLMSLIIIALFGLPQIHATAEESTEIKRHFCISDMYYEFTILKSETETYIYIMQTFQHESYYYADLTNGTNLVSFDFLEKSKERLAGLTTTTSSEFDLMDQTNDNCLDIRDLIVLSKLAYNNPLNFISNETGEYMSFENFTEILFYYYEIGYGYMTIKYGDVLLDHTTTQSETTSFIYETEPTELTVITETMPPNETTEEETTTSSTSDTVEDSTTTTTTETTITSTSDTVEDSTTTTTSDTVEDSTTTTFPSMDDLIDQYQQGMSDEVYDGLQQTVELFDLEYYKVVYSEELIYYSLIIPNDSFANMADITDYIGWQIAPIEDFEIINPEYNYTLSGYDSLFWRPSIDYDPSSEVDSSEYNIFSNDWNLIYDQYYWCIIPCCLNEEGEIVENLQLLYPLSE